MWNRSKLRQKRGFFSVFIISTLVVLALLGASLVYIVTQQIKTANASDLELEAVSRTNNASRSASGSMGNLLQTLLQGSSTSQTFSSILTSNLLASTATGRDAFGAAANVNGPFTSSGATADIVTDIVNSLNQPYTLTTLPASRVKVSAGQIVAKTFQYQFSIGFTDTANTADQISLTNQNAQQIRNLTIVEVPTQFAVENGTVNVSAAVGGSVVADNVTLASNVTGRVLARKALTWSGSPTIGGYTLPSAIPASLEILAQSSATWDRQVSYVPTSGEVSIFPLGDRTEDSEGVPNLLKTPTSSTNWDVYVDPYFSCSVRIHGAAAIDVTNPPAVSALPCYTATGNGTLAQRVTEFPSDASGFASFYSIPQPYLGGTAQLLIINAAAIPIIGGSRTLFVDLPTTSAYVHQQLLVGVSNAAGLDTPLSIVTPHPIALMGSIGGGSFPLSLITPKLLTSEYSSSATIINVGSMTRSTFVTTAPNNPYQLFAGNGVLTSPASLNLVDVGASVANLPPVTLKSWWIYVDAP